MHIYILPVGRNIRGGTCHSSPVPVWGINLIAYLPLLQPSENSLPDLDLNPGHRSSSASKARAGTVAQKAC